MQTDEAGGHTVSPGVVQRNDLVNNRWVCISPSLGLSYQLWVASLACTMHLAGADRRSTSEMSRQIGSRTSTAMHHAYHARHMTVATQEEDCTFSEEVDVQHSVYVLERSRRVVPLGPL